MPSMIVWAATAAAVGVLVYLRTRLRRVTRLPLPPGPPREPVIGHLRAIPPTNRAVIFHEWAKTYGDVMYLEVLGNPMIVLNTEQVAVDLLNKRSAIYSDRPQFTLYEMIGWSTTLSLMPYGKRFNVHRQLHNAYLNRTKCREYRPMQTLEARTLAKNLLESAPDKYNKLVNRFSTGVISQIVAGHRICSDDDPYMQTTEALHASLGRSGVPGTTSLDYFPFLRYLPAWFPGFPYSSIAQECRPRLQRLYDFPMETVQRQMDLGVAKPCFLSTYLEVLKENPDEMSSHDVKWAGAAMFGSTIWSTVTVFILAMLLHPECQVKGQQEIDAVVGQTRLPGFDDRESLPFVECIMEEVLRWQPPTELGVPHRLMEDDVYEGMFLPKGSTVFANLRAMSLDERTYSTPRSFTPERFLPQPGGRGEPHFASVYGFGRRICSGQHLADQSLWIAIASILSTCTISNAHDADGNPIVPKAGMSDGVSSHPNDFPFQVSYRDARVEGLLADSMLE
ncbi:cytochrome P450 [Roridomyces roridus]|uniref:Cytochrome P450 n=1 Tax=Roridomyces roridus TaxID=1738132 RepID=A0AAD7BQB7_9AGAR|nr:cytochrome P450 [Roridomyces roridus]